MDKQKDEDEVFDAGDFKIVAEKDISWMFDDSVIGYQKGLLGDSYTIRSNGECESCGNYS